MIIYQVKTALYTKCRVIMPNPWALILWYCKQIEREVVGKNCHLDSLFTIYCKKFPYVINNLFRTLGPKGGIVYSWNISRPSENITKCDDGEQGIADFLMQGVWLLISLTLPQQLHSTGIWWSILHCCTVLPWFWFLWPYLHSCTPLEFDAVYCTAALSYLDSARHSA